MENEILQFLDNVVESISVIEENLAGIGFKDYKTNRKRMIIVVKNFGIIMEEVNKIPQNEKNAHPEIDWNSFDGLLEKIMDTKMGINEEEVWHIAKMKLLKLKKVINKSFFS